VAHRIELDRRDGPLVERPSDRGLLHRVDATGDRAAVQAPRTEVSKRLGYSSAAITSDLYSHLLEDADRQMADAVQGVLDAPNRFEHTSSTH